MKPGVKKSASLTCRVTMSDHALLATETAHDMAISIDEALEQAGGWSAYQARTMWYLGAAMAAMASHMLAPIFLIPRLSSSWQLSPAASALQSSAFFVGYCIGVVLWSWFSDTHGRRPTILYSFALGNLCGIASFFAPSYSLFVAARCVCGIGIAGAKNGCFLIATELAPPAARARVGALVSYSWLCGLLFLVACARWLKDANWRWLVLTYIPALVLQIFLGRLVPECEQPVCPAA